MVGISTIFRRRVRYRIRTTGSVSCIAVARRLTATSTPCGSPGDLARRHCLGCQHYDMCTEPHARLALRRTAQRLMLPAFLRTPGDLSRYWWLPGDRRRIGRRHRFTCPAQTRNPLRDSNATIHPSVWTGPTKGETMATSLYDLSVPTFLQTVRAVAGLPSARREALRRDGLRPDRLRACATDRRHGAAALPD